jgi:hypothetical protein
MTAERQNRVVVLLKVNVLAAAQTDGHVGGGSHIAIWSASSNSPCLDEEFFNYSILRLVWNGASHFRRHAQCTASFEAWEVLDRTRRLA